MNPAPKLPVKDIKLEAKILGTTGRVVQLSAITRKVQRYDKQNYIEMAIRNIEEIELRIQTHVNRKSSFLWKAPLTTPELADKLCLIGMSLTAHSSAIQATDTPTTTHQQLMDPFLEKATLEQ